MNSESEGDSSSRRQSFMKMVGLGKTKRELAAERSSEDQEVAKVEEVKPREPLSGKDGRRQFRDPALMLEDPL